MTILAYSLDGTMRIRQTGPEHATVEIRSHSNPNEWSPTSYALDRALKIFMNLTILRKV